MTETNETTHAAQTPQDAADAQKVTDAPETPQEPAQQPQDDEQEPKNNEAAKYRRQVREVEAERDELSGKIGDMQAALDEARKQLVEQISGLQRPAALWAAGTNVSDLLDDAGRVDAGKVREAVNAAAESLGLSRNPRPDTSQGSTEPSGAAGDAFTDAFTRR